MVDFTQRETIARVEQVLVKRLREAGYHTTSSSAPPRFTAMMNEPRCAQAMQAGLECRIGNEVDLSAIATEIVEEALRG